MEFPQLKTTVEKQYNQAAKTYGFAAGPFGSDDIDQLLTNHVKQNSWNLSGVASLDEDSDKQTITLTGTCSSFYEVSNATLSLVFFLAAGKAQLLIKLDLGEDWTFTETFAELKGSVFQDVSFKGGTTPKYVFTSANHTDDTLENGVFETGLNFYAAIVPGGNAFQYVHDVLGEFADTTAVGPLTKTADGPNMSLTLGFQKTLERYFPILKNHAEIQLFSQFGQPEGNGIGLKLGTTFDFGSHKSLELYALLTPMRIGVLYLEGEFHGITLPGPGEAIQDFKDLIGSDDLYSSLPNEYQSSSHLALKKVMLGIGVKTLKPTSISLEIGTPGADPGWPLGSFATVTGVNFFANIQNPFESARRTIFVSVTGDVSVKTASDPIDMSVDATALIPHGGTASYEVRAGLAEGETLPITDLLGHYLPAVQDAPAITLSELGVDFVFSQPKNHYTFYAGIDQDHPVEFRFGGETALKLLYGSFYVDNYSRDGNPGGGIAGGIDVLGVESDFAYVMPGTFKITTHVPEFDIALPELVDKLVGSKSVFDGLDWFPTITFPQTDIYVARDNGNYTFAIKAQPSFGVIVLQVMKTVESGWAFAARLSLNTQKISTALGDGLSVLSAIDDMFTVDTLLFVFASAPISGGFQDDFVGTTGTKVTLPAQIKQGFYFYGQMTLNLDYKEQNLSLVQRMLGLDAGFKFDLMVYLSKNPSKDAEIRAGVQGNINIDLTGGNRQILLNGYLGAKMENGDPRFFLEGVVTTDIFQRGYEQTGQSTQLVSGDRRNLTAALSLELSKDAAYLAVSMLGSITFGPVTLSDLVLVVGIDTELIPSIGFAAQIDLNAYNIHYNSSIAFFFDSGEPKNSLIAGSVSDVTMADIITSIVGAFSSGRDEPPQWMTDLFSQISIKGLDYFDIPGSTKDALNSGDLNAVAKALTCAKPEGQFSFGNQNTLLVAGQNGNQDESGYWYITHYPRDNHITHYQLVDKGENIQVSLEAQFYYCDPEPGSAGVTLGPPDSGIYFAPGVFVAAHLKVFMIEFIAKVDVNPNKGIIIDAEIEKPIKIIPSFLELTGAGEQGENKGPSLSLATYKKGEIEPHFRFSGESIFMGMSTSADINISDKGVHIDLSKGIGDQQDDLWAGVEVKADLDNIKNFSFDFSAGVHINKPHVELWHIDLGTIPIKIVIDCELAFGAHDGDLFLELKDTNFDLFGHTFTIPGFELELSTDTLADLPGIIFDEVKHLIWDFLSDVKRWLEWVGKKFIQGVEEIGKVLEEVFHAIGDVWKEDRLVIVAVHEFYNHSEFSSITIIPDAPTGDVTQAMIDEAQAAAEDFLELLVLQKVQGNLKTKAPQEVVDFKISEIVVSNLEYDLEQTKERQVIAQGPLPTLVSLGHTDPFKAPSNFYTPFEFGKQFEVDIEVQADFETIVGYLVVTVEYAGREIIHPYVSATTHKFTADWDETAGNNYAVKYTAFYKDSAIPPYEHNLGSQTAPTLTISNVPTPSPLYVIFDASAITFNGLYKIEVSEFRATLSNGQVDNGTVARGVIDARHPQLKIPTLLNYELGTTITGFTYDLAYYRQGVEQPEEKRGQSSTTSLVIVPDVKAGETTTVTFELINADSVVAPGTEITLTVNPGTAGQAVVRLTNNVGSIAVQREQISYNLNFLDCQYGSADINETVPFATKVTIDVEKVFKKHYPGVI